MFNITSKSIQWGNDTLTLETGKDRIMEPNAGVGLKLGKIMLDYALTTVGRQSTALYTHVFSVRFSVNRNEKK